MADAHAFDDDDVERLALQPLGWDAYRELAAEFGVLERKPAPSLPADRLITHFEERSLRTAAELAFDHLAERPWSPAKPGCSIFDASGLELLPWPASNADDSTR